MRRVLTILLLVALPGVSWGQQGIDKYFAPKSQFYMRWDGFDGHREAFDNTATGKTLKGDTGKFIYGLWDYLADQIEPMLMHVDPDFATVAKEMPGVLSAIMKHGFAMAVEVSQFDPPEIQAVFVFPGNGGPKGKVSGFHKTILDVYRVETKKIKNGNMEMHVVTEPPIKMAFGSDATNAIMVIGNTDPAAVMRRRNDPGNNVTKHPLHKELKKFKEFHIWAQGYLDVSALTKSASALSPEVAKVIDVLGLNGLKSVTLHAGFDGLAECSVTDFNTAGTRKGLLALMKGHKFSLKELPPLPHDIRGFTAASLDATHMYDTFVQTGEGAVRVFSEEKADFIKESIKQAELLVGVRFRDELLDSLGNMIVTYNSPSESPLLNLGSVTLIKVKDEKKLHEAAAALQKGFPPIPNLELDVKFKKFRGVELVEIQLGPSFTTATFAIHNGWLVYSNYPQPVHGFIMRTQGDLPTWKMDERTAKAFAPFPKEFLSITMSDPAPGLQFMMSLAPPILSAMNGAGKQFLPGFRPFDVSMVPHPLEATRHLFPNISVITDNGKRMRFEARSSFPSPF